MFKGFRQTVILTIISRITGLLRDMVFAFFLGATELMDSWVIAFTIPNLARSLFGEGAASSSLIPVYSEELAKDRQSSDRLASTALTVVFVILSGIVLAGEIIIWIWYGFFSPMPATTLKLMLTGIMLPYMTLICLEAIAGGVLNSHRHFMAPAFAPIILNVVMIVSLYFGSWLLTNNLNGQAYFLACSVIVSGFLQLFTQLVPLKFMGVQIKPAWHIQTEAFKKVMLLMGPMILGLVATQLNTLMDKFIALWFSSSAEKGMSFILFGREIAYPMHAGAVSRLFYAQRLYQFPFGVFGISLATVVFPVMSAAAARKDSASLCVTIARGIKGAIFVAFPATVGLILVRKPLIGILFERGRFTSEDTIFTASILVCYSIGLTGFFMQQICSKAYYSTQDSRKPMRTTLLTVALNLILNLIFIWPMGAAGLALSTSLCSYLQVGILLKGLAKKFGRQLFDGVDIEIIKITVNTVIMCFATIFAMKLTGHLPQLIQIIIVVAVASGLYLGGAAALKIEMLSLITGRKSIK
ncbi:MAG: murein biosynthesis integral membrane protein MurJ [Phycisphaerae bacterium]|jgi:putative peptidoglycan lipid II flippase